MFNWLPALLLILAQGAMHQGGAEVSVNRWLAVVTAQVTQEHQFVSPTAPKAESKRETGLTGTSQQRTVPVTQFEGPAPTTETNLTRAFPLRAGPAV